MALSSATDGQPLRLPVNTEATDYLGPQPVVRLVNPYRDVDDMIPLRFRNRRSSKRAQRLRDRPWAKS